VKLARRYQVLMASGWCEDCEVSVIHDDATAEVAAASHARGLGHRVRVIQSKLPEAATDG